MVGEQERADGRHMKGVVVAGLVKALRRWQRSTGAGAVPGLEPEDLALLEARVFPTDWYPLAQYQRLTRACFELFCEGELGRLRAFTAQGIPAVYEGPHRMLLRRGNPRRTMQRLSAAWRTSHDFADASAEVHDDQVVVRITDYADLDELEGNVNIGWISGLAEAAGAEVLGVEELVRPWRHEGAEQRFRLDWRLP